MTLINGLPTAMLSVADRAVHYGDGLFETITIVDGKPRHWELHMQRLRRGCAQLQIPAPESIMLLDDVTRLSADYPRAIIKLIVTRGTGGRGYRPDALAQPTRIVSRHDWPEYPARYYDQGVITRLCDLRLARQPRLAGIKHLNRLEQVLARAEWSAPEVFEGILLDHDGLVIEGTMSNLLLWHNGELITPLLDQCGVRGVMRQVVLQHADASGCTVREQPVELDLLASVDEVWLCNSVFGIIPVCEIQGIRSYSVSDRHKKFL